MKTRRKILASALSVLMVATMSCYTLVPGGFAATNDGTSQTQSSSSKTNTTGKNTKDETVYVFNTASGSVKNVIVSDWLQNGDKQSNISDVSNLSNIQNVEGSQSHTTGSDGSLTWSADGGDIYYQGDSSAQVPVTMTVSYTLDGKSVSPSEIANKSGDVKIRFDYTNNSEQTINGNTIYTPFAVVSGVVLDNANFSDVSVSNGKLINDGDRTIIAGFAFPGLQSDLGVGRGTVDIPDYVEVTAHASDFKLDSTATVVSAGMFDSIDMDNFSTGDLTSQVNQLSSAMQQLMDGSSTLYDGISQLAEGSQQLAAGTGTLETSTASMPESTEALADGASQVNDGLDQMKNGTSTEMGLVDALNSVGSKTDISSTTLYGGTNQIAAGLAQLKGSPTDTSGSLYAAYNGAGQIATGADALATGAYTAIGSIGTGSGDTDDTLLKGTYGTGAYLAAADGALKPGDADQWKAAATAVTIAGKMKGALATSASQMNAAANAIDTGAITTVGTDLSTAATDTGRVSSDLSDVDSALDSAKSAASTLDNMDTTGMNAAQIQAIDSAKKALASASSASTTKAKTDAGNAQTAIGDASSKMTAAGTAVGTAKTALTQSATAAQGYSDAINQTDADAALAAAPSATDIATAKGAIGYAETTNSKVDAGLKQLAGDQATPSGLWKAYYGALGIEVGATDIQSGMSDAISGVDKLILGTTALQSGIGILKSGTNGAKINGKTSEGLQGAVDALGDSSTNGTLIYGSNAVAEGTETLAQAAPALVSGIQALNTGAQQLASGSVQAQDGSMQLSDGLKQFNDEGVQKIVDVLGGDVGTASSRLTDIVKAGKDYNNYSGKSDSMDGSVKFVMETDAVGE